LCVMVVIITGIFFLHSVKVSIFSQVALIVLAMACLWRSCLSGLAGWSFSWCRLKSHLSCNWEGNKKRRHASNIECCYDTLRKLLIWRKLQAQQRGGDWSIAAPPLSSLL
jgi:hypothetical protein